MSAVRHFETVFGATPEGTGSAPGRVNLIGEHVDYNGGMVLPAAIGLMAEVAAGRAGGGTDRIWSAQFGALAERGPGAPKTGTWSDHAAGALDEARALGLIDGPACLAVDSEVPDGAGLSSSAALITAVLRACGDLTGRTMDPVRLAEAARRVENDYVGVPCGIMDQMAVGLTGPGEALALDTARMAFKRVSIPEDFRFIVIHSGVRRELSDGRYAARFGECAAARDALGAEHLCRLDAAQTARIGNLPASLAARTRHVVSEHRRAVAAVGALERGDAAGFGALMNESHASYSRDFAASTPAIDALVEDAVRLGAFGARLTGGGFGGCTVSLVPAGRAEGWTAGLLERHPAAFPV